MESSEDDAGTATNASRRVSAREKDVGLAEDVNATSSLHQKPSEERSTNETPAMSEDNFDGDSVPSPSSQDVNTSTEAILDMIDEIVDGPDAPKRLPLSPEIVDGLSEELAATSYNLNIIQDSVKSIIENVTPQQIVSPVNSVPVDSEVAIPGNIDTIRECSKLDEISTNDENTKSLDLLAASSSVLEGEVKVVSIKTEDISVSNVVTETSTNCPLLNIPSSSEEQTVQNVSDISVSEQQDRTVKCVTSSDTRDNVTVESAESTSSDSSVSESKASFVEPQVRSPLRRRLVRPLPSDRRPDSTVSSTVDSQSNDNVIAAEQSSSENIAKDVTSSSDAVPMVYDNVKPEEISNVSEINYCNAETSVSPKKIKLVRQQNTTGISNRDTLLNKTTILKGNEQCQSTSHDNHSGNLSISTAESSSTVSLLKSQDSYDNSVLENNSSDKQTKQSAEKENCNEHSQSEKTLQSTSDNSQQVITCEQISTVESCPVLVNDNTCHTEQEPSSLSISDSSKQIVETVDLEQSYSYNSQDNEDFIPLHLPPKNKLLKSSDIKLRNENKQHHGVVPSAITQDVTKTCEIKSNSEQESQSNKFQAEVKSKSKCHKVDCDVLEGQIQSTSSDEKSCLITCERIDSESRNTEVGPKSIARIAISCEPKLESNQPDSCSTDLMSKSDKSEVKISKTDYKVSNVESNNSKTISEIKDLSINSDKSIEFESRSGEPDLKNSEVISQETEKSNCSLESIMCKSESLTTESNNSELDSKVHPKDSDCRTSNEQIKDIISYAERNEAKSEICELEPSDITTELQSAQCTSQESEIQSSSSTEQLQSAQCISQNTEVQSSSSTTQLQSGQCTLQETKVESSGSTAQLQSAQCSSQEIELKSSSNTGELQSVQCTSQETKLQSSSSTEQLQSIQCTSQENISTEQLQSAQCTSQETEFQSSGSTEQLQSAQGTILETELKSKHVEQVPRSREFESSISPTVNCQKQIDQKPEEDEAEKKVPPIKLNLSRSSMSEPKLDSQQISINKNETPYEDSDSIKQVPKLTIKLKQPEEIKPPVPKLTIKPIRPPVEQEDEKMDNPLQVPCVTKINIKPIVKPAEIDSEKLGKSQSEVDKDIKLSVPDQVPCITKLNIKPIVKPPEKINDIHRKSSSSEISESECSENDETTSTSDQTSTSDHGSSDVVPKVTIKLGKPGTESEGKFYTEKNVPKLTIKGIQQEEKLIISQSDEIQPEKIPKLTIKTVNKCEGQPLSPKLTIKPLKPPDSPNKVKMSTDLFSTSEEGKEVPYVPKITIKPVTRMDGEPRTPKKSTTACDSSENIRAVTKLNIKPILKPADSGESSEVYDNKVPVVSKLNIKPVIKPKDNDVDSSVDEVPKITKLNIKPLKNPEDNSSKEKDCNELNAVIDGNSIPVVTKINIKPIVKPQEEKEKDSENLSSETGNSSDDNGDHIPVVTKLNIKPIVKPDELQESKPVSSNEQSIPVVTKLNIKPLIKPGESSPSSPKKEQKIDSHNTSIPVVTKLNIKPVIRPEDAEEGRLKDDSEDKSKNPPLVMKINFKSVVENVNHESANDKNMCNDETATLKIVNKPVAEKSLETKESKSHGSESVEDCLESKSLVPPSEEKVLKQNCVPESIQKHEENDRMSVIKKQFNLNTSKVKVISENRHSPEKSNATKHKESPLEDSNSAKEGKSSLPNETQLGQEQKNINFRNRELTETNIKQPYGRQKISVQNCTLLKKLLENTRDNLDKKEVPQVMNCTVSTDKSESTIPACKNIVNSDHMVDSGKSAVDKTISLHTEDKIQRSSTPDKMNDHSKVDSGKFHSIQELTDKVIDNITKPLEISVSDKTSNQSSGQDSPRIILKINKTDHGPLAKIITEDVKRPDTPQNYTENTQDNLNDKQSPKKHVANRRKQASDTSLNLSSGKRLRSSRIVENTEKSQIKRHSGKRPSTAEPTSPEKKDTELSILQAKRLKLGQLLSANKSISPVVSPQISPTKAVLEPKSVNHSLLNNENCSKNGNSKLHNILSNLQAKQIQSLAINNTNCTDKAHTVPSDVDCNTSLSSSDTTEVVPPENSHIELQQMIINENSDFRDLSVPEESSQDPLEVAPVKPIEVPIETIDIPKPVELTPQPKKRGRPRKLPVSEGAKPVVTLPVTALEERPQRSLRLMRDRPAIIHRPRGRGRGRGARRAEMTTSVESPSVTTIEPAPEDPSDERPTVEIDPTSSRIKLPRMTEALDKMPSMCQTPLSSRRRSSSAASMGDTHDLKDTIDSPIKDEFPNTPEISSSGRPRGGRGSRGGRGRTPRGRGRGRGGGRGAMYMKETLGIYGRVCGPATTTVQLFEEETCMMDDNATPAKPSHLLDEDSQSSVKSSTNESSKLKRSKFADLFDSNKVWTAADVKEYTWPSAEKADEEQKVMMIQEQVAMFLGVKSFKRRYPELKRRTISGDERDYVLSKGLVTEALCDLGITAVDASEVLDIMLSDYPHKYEEYRSHQRQRQRTVTPEESMEESKPEEKIIKLETKVEKPIEQKPELPKVDPEKTRLDMAAAAIASASEFNARVNISRRAACADLQSLTVLAPRPAPTAPARPHLRPPAGFYPHALLPGQYQHSYRVYPPEQLRYFPLNTVLAAPPAPVSTTDWSSESEPDWGSHCSSSDDSDLPSHSSAKRKKITKVKRVSHAEASTSIVKEEPRDEVVDLCRVCKLRLEANRKYTHERFLVCANCNAKLHPSCVELNADTIRKCREYPWQCAECKTCCSCRQPADDDKMLFCDLCDRGFHIYCVGLETVPSGRWHCVECAVCKSCGARSPGGLPLAATCSPAPAAGPPAPAEWHHQTRRGPGGHKVYSHSLCTPCARAYRIGRYCPLCERSFIGPKGTMQLVICKLCDRQLHQDCVRQTVSSLNVLDYTCAECRRGGITSRAAAVRLAPRTIATLFMAKRRFNKYAHRQYLQSRLRERADAPDAPDDNSVDVPDDPDAGDPLDVPDVPDAPDAPE